MVALGATNGLSGESPGVRYGNGGSGDGLTKLSQALKKLIEEAIEKATKSFTDREEQLQCPDNPSDKDSHCSKKQKEVDEAKEKNSDDSKVLKLKSEKEKHYNTDHYMTKEDRDKELHGINDSRISLGHLAGQLGGFVGESESVKKAVKNAIKAYFDTNPDLKNDLKHLYSPYVTILSESVNSVGQAVGTRKISELSELVKKEIEHLNSLLKQPNNHLSSSLPSPSSSAESAELHSKLEALRKAKELCEFLTNPNNQQNEPKNILNNLCTGLETFLGFNKESKGYDGNGIAYSDLDRLCDGVMGFLFSCLEGSKELLKHEYPQITETINTLKSSMGKGLGVLGFANAIEKVRSGLQGYEEELTRRTEAVKNQLSELNDSFSDLPIDLHNEKAKPLETQFSEWTQRAKLYATSVTAADDAKKKLDPVLRRELDVHMKLIIQTVNNFKKKCENKDIDNLNNMAKQQLYELQMDVEGSVAKRIIDMRENLQGKFEKDIQVPIKKVNDMLRTVNRDLNDWMKSAQSVLNAAKDIVRQIINEVKDDDGNKHPKKMADAAGEIVMNSDTLRKQFEGLKQKYNEVFDKLRGKEGRDDETSVVGKLKVLDRKVKDKMPDRLDNFEEDSTGNVWNLKNQIVNFKKAINTQFGIAIDNIWKDLKQGLDAAKESQPIDGNYLGLNALKSTELWNAKHVSRWVESAMGDDSPHGPGVKLEKVLNHLNGVKTVWETIAEPNITTNIVKGIKDELGNKTLDGVKQEIFLLLTEAIIKAIAKFHGEVTNIVENDLKKIDNRIESFVSQAMLAKSTIDSKAIEVNSNLQQLCESIEKLAGKGSNYGLTQKISSLINMVNHTLYGDPSMSLSGLQRRLNTIIGRDNDPASVLGIIANTGVFYQKLQADTSDCIRLLRDELQQQFRSATTNIQYKAQELYAQRKKKEFTSLKIYMDIQQSAIEKTIKYNRANGLKGFLDKLYGHKGDTLSKLKLEHVREDTKRFIELSNHLKAYFDPTLLYILKQGHTSVAGERPHPNGESETVSQILEKLGDVLTHLGRREENRKFNFDSHFTSLLTTLSSSLSLLSPSTFANPRHPELLDAVRQGLQGFVDEMGKVYVNGYDNEEWNKDYEKHYAKAFFSILNTLYDDLLHLRNKCEDDSKYSWKHKKLCLTFDRKENLLGAFLQRCGYEVAKNENSKECELKLPMNDFTGQKLLDAFGMQFLSPTYDRNLSDILESLFTNLKTYNQVCHLSTLDSRKHPCSVFEMLCWLNGLTHQPVYFDLTTESFSALFDKPEKKNTDSKKDGSEEEEDGPTVEDFTAFRLMAYPNDIKYSIIQDSITHISSMSHNLLTTILGFGDKFTLYASDFSNNSLKLYYPAAAGDCLEMFVDVIRALLLPLKFLESQCALDAKYYGWGDCQYGKDIPTTKSHCDIKSTDKTTSQAKCQPTCQVNTKPNCQPTSPLMSYLNDCLPGHLPHHLSTIGCKAKCSTCPKNSPGMPCLTPLGFRGFSGSTRIGKDLCRAIVEFFGDVELSRLLCLYPKPPATLPEHFSFVLSLATGINVFKSKQLDDFKTLHRAFESSIRETTMDLYGNPSSFTSALQNAYGITRRDHPNKHPEAANADLSTLCMNKSCVYPNRNVYCGPYLYSLSSDMYSCLAIKHSGLYLSSALYLPWTLYKHLKALLDAFSAISCKDSGCRRCKHDGTCSPGKHGVDNTCQCRSMVSCGGVLSTFYSYGFTFGDLMNLLDVNQRRYCRDFGNQLRNVLNSSAIKTLFDKCDDFLFKIRAPFIWLNVALWLLSLLYLTHIMVIRLDLLHIKSHLHSPSSHRIAAQSLLAASRVGKLNRVFYLQP